MLEENPMIALVVEHQGAEKLIWTDDREDYNYKNLRNTEMEIVTSKYIPLEHNYKAIYDLRYYTQFQAGLGILQTIVVCIILSLGALRFQKITHDLVIKPIE